MKRILFIITALVLTVSVSFAQGKKSLKEAQKKFKTFSESPFGNAAVLEEAKALLDEAFQDEKVSSDPKNWITMGDIYYNSSDAQMKAKLLNPEAKLVDSEAALKAYDAYMKAYEMATKGGHKKAALKGLRNVEDALNNTGIELYQVQDYAGAYKNFDAELAAHELLKTDGKESRLDEGTLYTEKLYFAGLCAFYGKDYAGAESLLGKAQETGTEEASLYQIMFESMKEQGKVEEGLAYLEKGREMFPDETSLLFSEINYYLGKGELDRMIGKLEQALANEPDNASVMMTLGQVYDQLQVKANEDGDAAKADEHFNNALKYYKLVLDTDPSSFDSNYGVGALYYNKAAGLTPMLNEVANDFSKAGEAKYNEIKEKMDGLFNEALPYFLKADEINNQDRNTVIALKEIYARKGDFEKSNEYKTRLESL